MPDAMEIIYQKALDIGTSAAVSKRPFILLHCLILNPLILFINESVLS
jgi:hypothetical protein